MATDGFVHRLEEADMRLASILIVPVGVAVALVAAPPASSDCTSAAGTSVCSQGEVRGANTGQGPGSNTNSFAGPCWWCNDGLGLTFIIQRPDRPRGGGGRGAG